MEKASHSQTWLSEGARMGGFTTSIHLQPASATMQTVASALIEVMEGEGFVLAPSGETPDRGIIIVRTSRAPNWLAIFDEHAENQDETNEHLAKALSLKLRTPA